MRVKPKKSLGQHFLKDESICIRIEQSITNHLGCKNILEIGPGTGALTKHILASNTFENFYVMEVDRESIKYLNTHYSVLTDRIIEADFLQYDSTKLFQNASFCVVGNFPYNISSQILFRCLEYRDLIPEIVGMFQKEVAERISQKPGKKQYGILSVFMQAFYDVEYLFTVDEHVFDPPPKVKSGVIRCRRNTRKKLDCDEQFFKKVVKTAFNQRRKTLRNSLKSLTNGIELPPHFSGERPEQLGVSEFIELTNLLMPH
jgi:16S rRNA (adenine1518-N6/adenine1519-N6)-dimethyltransferase